MKTKLPIENLLEKKGIEYKLIRLSNKAYTVSDVVRYSGGNVNPDEICKTIILKGKKTDKKYAVFLRGNDKVDFAIVKRLFGEEVTIASEEGVKETAGVEPGAVCPFLLNIPLYIDNRVMKLEKINCGSGNHLYGLEFEVKDLSKCLDYKVVDLSRKDI